jgi:hypothetical protein
MTKAGRPPGPYYRDTLPSGLRTNTREAAYVRGVVRALTEHVGGGPSTVQRLMIERVAQLQLRMALMDQMLGATGELSEKQSNTYLAWSNSVVRTLAALGIDAVEGVRDPLTEIHAKYGQRANG